MNRATAKIIAAPLLTSGLGSLALFAAGAGGWKGEPNPCIAKGDCFCEALRGGWINQPANNWSALAFYLVGVAVAVHAARRLDPASENPMRQDALFPALFAGSLALVGPGTMALHAAMTKWGGQFDSISMYFLGAFIVVYGLLRLGTLPRRFFFPAYLALSVPLAATKWTGLLGTNLTFGSLVAAGACLEIYLTLKKRGDARWLGASAGLFLTALGIWMISHTGGLWCSPYSLWQGHAVWHILTALAGGAVYLHYSQE